MKLTLVIPFVLTLFLIGCGNSSSSSSSADTTTTNEEKAYVYDKLRTSYYSASEVTPDADLTQYASDTEVLEALKYKQLDRFSTILSLASYTQISNQESGGIGVLVDINDTNMTILEVYAGTPADENGLQRGDIITNKELLSSADATYPTYRYYVSRGDQNSTYDIQSVDYTYDVVYYNTIEQNGEKIGYLRYESFTNKSTANLYKAFESFEADGVTQLVIDLRYNGGGLVSIASLILDLIGGKTYNGQTQFSLDYNTDYSYLDQNYTFAAYDSRGLTSLPSKVTFITTDMTASASEIVINALKPYISNVSLVGSTTYGKPVGMQVDSAYDKIYLLINFKTVNVLGQGEYFNGITPTCEAADDLTHALGSTQEASLQTALYYLQYNSCP